MEKAGVRRRTQSPVCRSLGSFNWVSSSTEQSRSGPTEGRLLGRVPSHASPWRILVSAGAGPGLEQGEGDAACAGLVGELSPGNELQLHPRQVQSSFLSSKRPAPHIPKVAGTKTKEAPESQPASSSPVHTAFSCFQLVPNNGLPAPQEPRGGFTERRVHCKLKTAACQSKAMFLSTEKGLPLWGADKRASERLSSCSHTKAPLCL